MHTLCLPFNAKWQWRSLLFQSKFPISMCAFYYMHMIDNPLKTLCAPAFLSISIDRGRAHCAAPLNIPGSDGVGVPILFENDLLWNNLPYSKGSLKFGCLESSTKNEGRSSFLYTVACGCYAVTRTQQNIKTQCLGSVVPLTIIF